MTSLQKILKDSRPLGVYFQSWSSNWASSANNLDLSKIELPINLVFLSFVNPNCSYVKGSNSFSGTGLDFSSEFLVVKNAIEILKNKGIIVMLSVGGATYPFTTYNSQNVAALANDLGCNGIDIDWEPIGGATESSKLGPIISSTRKEFPNGLISIAGFSVGAYGQDEFQNAEPKSQNTGMCIEGLKSNGHQLDFICIMSYDASPVYNPLLAFDAYRKYFSGPLLLGCEVPPEAWGGHILTLDEVKSYSKKVVSDNQSNGIFVWSYQKQGTPSCGDIVKTSNEILKTNSTSPQPNIPTPTPEPIIQPQPPVIPEKPVVKIENWTLGKIYTTGSMVVHDGTIYSCNVQNIASGATVPGISLWSPVNIPQQPIQPKTSEINWEVGIDYLNGKMILYNGYVYKCINSHKSQSDWTPDITPSLWFKMFKTY